MKRFVLLWIICLAVFSSMCFGQTAQITGLISDSSKAVMPGAKVTVTNLKTGTVRETESNSEGFYLVPLLQPGSYGIRVQATGFKPINREGLTLLVDQAARVDFVMEVGGLTESVNISAQAQPLLTTTSATASTVIDNKRIQDLPLNDRDPLLLAGLAPGVLPGLTTASFEGRSPLIGGGRRGTNEVTVDGTSSILPENNSSVSFQGYMPPVDAIQEFSVLTNTFSAEYGHSGGGVINVVTKQGTNTVHASLYEYLRNSQLDSNNFFSNRAGVKRAAFQRNQFGGTVGGPVHVPGIYDGHNRTFFFFDFQGTRSRQANILTTTFPLEAWRRGDFSNLRNSAGAALNVYDPLTTRDAGGGNYTRDAFSGNRIPDARIDPVARQVVQYYPSPNTAPVNAFTQLNNFTAAGKDAATDNRFDIRLDHNESQAWRTSARLSMAPTISQPWDFFDNPASTATSVRKVDFYNATIEQTYIANPTTIVSVRYGFSRMYDYDKPYSNGFDMTQLGFPAYLRNQAAKDNLQFPAFAINGLSNIGNAGYAKVVFAPNSHIVNADVTKMVSRHALKMGLQYRKELLNFLQYSYPSGYYAFTQQWTQQNPVVSSATAGFGLASFLVGVPTSGYISHSLATASASNYFAGYVQDDVRATRNLTVNLGLRYEVDTPRKERYNRQSYFDLNAASPIAGKVPGFPNLVGAMMFCDSSHRQQTPTDLNNFGPRVGFAYRMGTKTTARGGYGLMYARSTMQVAGATGTAGNEGFTNNTNFVSSLDSRTPIHFLRDPFPDGFSLPQGPAPGPMSGPSTLLGQLIGAGLFIDYVNPVIQQWNFTLQRELPGNMLVEAGYLGSKGNHLGDGETMALNQLPSSFFSMGNSLNDLVANPFYGVITDPTSTLSQPTVRRSQLLRPYPQYTSVNVSRKPQANSLYHAFTVRVEKRYAQSLGFLLSYTSAKLIDDASQVASLVALGTMGSKQDYYNRKAERAVSPQDISSRLVFSFTYDLPVGAHRKFLNAAPAPLQWLAGGWQFNGILSFQTGTPVVLTQGANNTGLGSASQRPNSNGRSAHLTGGTKDARLKKWFDPSVFSIAPAFTWGNVGRALPNVRNPGMRNLDMSLFRNFRFRGERINLQFRAEAFNAMNTAQFGAPGAQLDSSNIGVISSTAVAPRQIQLVFKVLF